MNPEDRAVLKRALWRDRTKMAAPMVAPLVALSPISIELLVIPSMVLASMEEDVTLPVV